jgi:hypothetical protein
MHVVESYSNNSDDETKEWYAAEFVWPAQNKLVTCPSLKPIHKNRNEEVKFTFDFSKCDRIFDELLKFSYLRINYTLPSAKELKRRAPPALVPPLDLPLLTLLRSSSSPLRRCSSDRRTLSRGRFHSPEGNTFRMSYYHVWSSTFHGVPKFENCETPSTSRSHPSSTIPDAMRYAYFVCALCLSSPFFRWVFETIVSLPACHLGRPQPSST